MLEIDRPVVGSQRWRRHPFYPFEVKRHGSGPDRPNTVILRKGIFRQPTTATVNGTFSELAVILPDFSRQSAWICDSVPEICASLRTYETELLTMIKNVLIAAISFVSLNQ
jgi:hypothetical protein